MPGRLTVVSGGCETGALYGCQELAHRITIEGELPREIAFGDAPVYKLRGPAIGLQKTHIEPPRLTYEYPITPSCFPWFYDRAYWIEYLDLLTEWRCNVLYIWSGHPFSSLVRLADYPEALEVTEEEFALNRAMLNWLTEESDRRGIWIVFLFYNIHIPLPFAEKHGLPLLQNSINPLVARYTYESIAEFVKTFPNVGLMVCLGEALRGIQNKTAWFIDTIIPAVKEGMRRGGLTEEPPLILRGHDCDPIDAIGKAAGLYNNLYTMWKYNGEGLTTYFPIGNWQERHQELSSLKSTHIINVHILANLEPFRFNAPAFIQKCAQAGQYRLGANGLHLYPLFYWDWPLSPDRTEPRLKQYARDRIWYQAWFRYAWQPHRDPEVERLYWIAIFAKQFQIAADDAEALLSACELVAHCLPRILGRIGITEGNRQTLALGMTMSQLTNPVRYRPNLELWRSVARRGPQPIDFIRDKLQGNPIIGETPEELIEDIDYFAGEAERCLRCFDEKTRLDDELCRMIDDLRAIILLGRFYSHKLQSALAVIEYRELMDRGFRGPTALLDQALESLENSVAVYRDLTRLGTKRYLFVNSMQTRQRKIPFPDGSRYAHWKDCLPEYEEELANFRHNAARLLKGNPPSYGDTDTHIHPLSSARFSVHSEDCEEFDVVTGELIFTDRNWQIRDLAEELVGLTGIRINLGKAIDTGVQVCFELEQDSLVLIGYMQSKGIQWLQVPELETNTHADEHVGMEPVLRNALKADGCPPINVHALRYEKGSHTFFGGTGGFCICGIIPADMPLKPRDAGKNRDDLRLLDWMYTNEMG